jgi:hypothetical protein
MTCHECGGPVTIRPFPTGYYGAGRGSLLYHYTRLLSPDNRYIVPGRFAVASCDPCQNARVVSRPTSDAPFVDNDDRGDPASVKDAGNVRPGQ